jgi:hypothetical protein
MHTDLPNLMRVRSISRAARVPVLAQAVLLVLAVAHAAAQDTAWRATARGDLEAAREFLAATHPGAHPRLRDSVVVSALTAGYADAWAKTAFVTDAAGTERCSGGSPTRSVTRTSP